MMPVVKEINDKLSACDVFQTSARSSSGMSGSGIFFRGRLCGIGERSNPAEQQEGGA